MTIYLPDEYLAFAPDGSVIAYRSLASVCRHAQAAQVPALSAWWLNREESRVEPVELCRDGPDWVVIDAGGAELGRHEATALSDPRTIDAINHVEMRLGGLVDTRAIAPALWSCGAFAPTDAEARIHPLGFHDPTVVNARWVWEYCPEIVAATAAALADDEWPRYLDYVALRAKMRMNAPDLDPDAFDDAVADAVYAAGPQFSTLVGRVRMAALDAPEAGKG